jgi:hypothetical protein
MELGHAPYQQQTSSQLKKQTRINNMHSNW